jgi:hypothetical protein
MLLGVFQIQESTLYLNVNLIEKKGILRSMREFLSITQGCHVGNGLPLSGRIAIKAAVPTQGCIQVGHPYIAFETVRMELQFNLSIQCT